MKLTAQSDLTPYLKELNRNQRKVFKANLGVGHQVINLVFNKGATFLCKACGKLLLPPANFKHTTCDPSCADHARGSAFRGKKRPEHAAFMKVKMKELIAEGATWTEEHRANNRAHMKRMNASLDRAHLVETRSSCAGLRRRFERLAAGNSKPSFIDHPAYLKSSLASLKVSQVAKASEKQLLRWNKQFNSIKSAVAMERNPTMGSTQFYKRIKVTGLKFNVQRRSIVTRSSLEYDFVRWLETRKIRWVYEWTRLELGEGRIYIPDFKIKLNGEYWVVETKGVYFSRTGAALTYKKEKAAAAWCRAKGYKFVVLSSKQIGRLGSEIDPSRWIDLAARTDRQLVQYLKKTIPGNKCS